ncbi:hypothetical protein BAUCODRAFT_33448 [Baudoinia panamericana UAMH 10762]|uniref:SAP domain-containing protein n=1 Tax=Baudoinia panamericana (strain UAMH 10762) TaxID=717646 RepID=M2MM20_BAUPA|nr:uncharacterized protein BAUCODRAFT_33448 [Baudoinia panamericana UAMH 10762]EMC97726.1 hypothetical protein BAUCODRAFT_33448 [Baudoinia panamericana UAMH 10762]
MAAPRATQFVALRNLARGSRQTRSLHMTGPATYASPVLTKERPVLNLPTDIAGLRAECKRRKIEVAGSKSDLISRLNAHELANSRAFSTAIEQSRRPTAEAEGAPKAVRHFNVSRTLKTNNDTSTIDFAYFPDADPDNTDQLGQIRVPIIPTNMTPPRTGAHAPEVETVVMKPMISAMSADAVYLPMADMSDGHALNVDFHAMADRVAANIRRLQVPVEEQASIMKQLWSDLVDDMMGKKLAHS